MSGAKVTKAEKVTLGKLVDYYRAKQGIVSTFRNQLLSTLQESQELLDCVHSIKSRLKEPAHLQDKLERKLIDSKKHSKAFKITESNLFVKVNDLAGIRILHLYTRQIQDIDRILRKLLMDQRYKLVEGPFARTWDDESREYFKACGIETETSPSMYTSVHYVVESFARTKVTCEIQVRTLMEEVWGEVDHKLNYPYPHKSRVCQEQLKVLARVTSSASRLVDSIFLSSKI